jgi:type VI secretion system protein VasG
MANLSKLVATLSPSLKKALENGVGEAMKRKSASVEIEHWIFHMLFGPDHELISFLETQGVDLNVLQTELDQKMLRGSGTDGAQPTISGSVAKLLEQSWILSSVDLGMGQILPEIVLLAMLQPNEFGLPIETIKALNPISTDALRSFAEERGQLISSPINLNGTKAPGVSNGNAIVQYTVNLTQLSRDGKIDTVLGRTEEIAKAIDVLLRKRQNNPIFLGQPGVGKTAIVEGLANKIVSGDVPEALKNCELVSLDMGLLQAGASMKGEFEERLKNVIKEVQSSDVPMIVFIDEAHTMIGAGGAEGQNDAANLLKPALARGEFRTIGATTFLEYKKYFEKDPALSRRFQPISVEEPARDASVNILRAVSEGLRMHHGVFVREEAIKAAVDLSIRFMPARRLPDKAISVMDTACARVSLSQHARPKEIELLEEKLRFAEVELEKTVKDADLFGNEVPVTADMSLEIENLKVQLTSSLDNWAHQKDIVTKKLAAANSKIDEADSLFSDQQTIEPFHEENEEEVFVHPWVTEATIASVISDWTGVPVSALKGSEAQRLLTLESSLKQRVMGQDVAIEAMSRSLKVSRAGLTDVRKPIGVFLMCGPSGVGKTETGIAIADQFFGGEDAMVTINMSEFKEAHKSSMLLGASAGYVGYGKGGVLTEAVRQRPYCVLLLDEMEKAHPAIHDIFFQIFDKGKISDSEGTVIDFRNTIIIMTSNAGGEEIRDYIDTVDHEPTSDEINVYLKPKLLEFFSPAFIGRTEVIAYRPLNDEVNARIVEIHLERIKKRIQKQYDADFIWNQSFTDYVVNANTDPLSGGRALESIINKIFLPKLAEECINRIIERSSINSIIVSHDGNKVVIDAS